MITELENKKFLTQHRTWSQHVKFPSFGPFSLDACEDKIKHRLQLKGCIIERDPGGICCQFSGSDKSDKSFVI